MKGDLRCIDGRLWRHDPQQDDPYLETDVGECPDCSGDGCDDEPVSAAQELLPCPFCGGTAIIERRDVNPQGDPWYGATMENIVRCDCGACLFDELYHEGFVGNEDATAAWNRRASVAPTPSPDLAAENARLRGALERIAIAPPGGCGPDFHESIQIARAALESPT